MGKLLEKLTIDPESVKSVMAVCTANRCRSPMAEGILKKEFDRAGLGHIRVSSAGTMGWDGEPPSRQSVQVLADIGIDIREHKSSALTEETVEDAGLILVMEKTHIREILKQYPGAREKTILMGTFLNMDSEAEIDDPIGRPDIFYQHALFKIQRSVEGLINWLAAPIGIAGKQSLGA
jgi:protein-tyrosine-phosphatase